jgi:hypothetical protein
MKNDLIIEPSSFRDPQTQVFYRGNRVFRQIHISFADQFDGFIKSGLYKNLVDEGLMLPFKKVRKDSAIDKNAYCVIETEKIPFISYPYEWSFSQLKDAALLTLKIQEVALKYGFILRDSSAYNIQFLHGRPVLMDSLSLETYKEGQPWVGYRQFCQHFLGPLALMSYKDLRLNKLFQANLDGIPMDLVNSLLPVTTWFDPRLLTHLHLHSKSQLRFSQSSKNIKNLKMKMGKHSLLAIVDSLKGTVDSLRVKLSRTEWSHYYSFTNYTQKSFGTKKKIISTYLRMISPSSVWDLGANTGEFSRLASSSGIHTVAFDNDPLAVEKNYLEVKKNGEKNLLPLFLDLANPSPSLGWQRSFLERGPADCILSLALIHHLAIANNIPLKRIAEFMSQIGNFLIIEFVPKEDSQTQILLASREDIFDDYNRRSFESAFLDYFNIIKLQKIDSSERRLYCMKKI